jgi:hypothetical protein
VVTLDRPAGRVIRTASPFDPMDSRTDPDFDPCSVRRQSTGRFGRQPDGVGGVEAVDPKHRHYKYHYDQRNDD